ncbi:MAG: hypothetical protein Q8Q85_08835 [Gemmatimonadales bacterium]|nr:hypothetical protein [Gemmatimonadales bacterium]
MTVKHQANNTAAPNLVRRLEAEAQGMRAQAEELNAMIAGLGDEAPLARSTSLRESPYTDSRPMNLRCQIGSSSSGTPPQKGET